MSANSTNNNIMKRNLTLLAALLFASLAGLHATDVSASKKPNIIFILADDLGIGSVSCYGADNFKTPNIDKLAASGIRFEHCYAAPLCGPSRALLMTGRYAFRTGMTSNQTGDLLKPGNEIMMPTVLKQAGYVTAQVGKWAQLPLEPGDWGFDEYLRFQGSGQYWNTQKTARRYTVNGKEVPLKDGEYLPDKMQDFAVNFITRHKDQPFYLYYAMSHVHAQILPTPDSSPANKRLMAGALPLYQDNVAYMDKLVGKLIAELDQLKLREKTIIVFTSDNGTMNTYKKFCTVNGGKQLSGCKATMLEGGALVPMCISWPGTTPAGKVANNLISFCDFFPTLAELAGAKLPPGVTIDGKPFTPMFYGQTQGEWLRDWIFVLLGHNWFDRELNWKMNQSGELFDMHQAPFAEPLVAANPENKEAAAARQRLQTVLDQLNPAAGKVDPGGLGNQAKKKNRAVKNQPTHDSENTNAPDQ
jgi:arylsulfatase A